MKDSRRRFLQFGKTYRTLIIGLIVILAFAMAAIYSFSPPHRVPTAAATACPQNSTPQYNIIYCGLSGPALNDYISSFQGYYTSNTDGHAQDLQAVYNWSGATMSSVSGMNSSNTALGTVYNNGVITVNGQVIGNNAWVAGRWNNNGAAGFTHLEGNVWIRAATTFLAPEPQVQVLVHFNDSGQADFAVMTGCGNAVKFTPTVPPKQSLTCDQLTASEVDSTLEYTFTAKATPTNTTISNYTFYFGDGSQQTINTSSNSVTTNHTYSQAGSMFSASVVVNGSVTSNNCQAHVSTPASPSLQCSQLTFTKTADRTYSFIATANPQNNATITGYTFYFGDGSQQTINTSDTQVSTTHTYGQAAAYTASVSVNGSNVQTATSQACQAQVNITPPSPPVLTNTGPGKTLGIFGVTSTLAGFAYHLFLRRRLLA